MGQNNGDSDTSLTVDSAAHAIEGLLSETPETEQSETATPEPKDEVSPEVKASKDEEVDTALPSDEEPADEEEIPDEGAPAPKTFKVKVDDQEVEVPEDELVKGYSRHADYTRKTQKLADEKKAFETEANAVRAERQQTAAKLSQLDHALTSLVQEPDWDKLQRENPTEFAQVHAAWQVHEKRLTTIRTEQARIEQQLSAEAATQYQQLIAAERAKLTEAIPEWKDAAISKKDMADLVDYATGKGFSNTELDQVSDHRAIILLRKAMLYDRAEEAKAAATRTAQGKIDKVKTAVPGSAASAKPKGTEMSRRMQRLKNSGKQSDAASAIELMLGDG